MATRLPLMQALRAFEATARERSLTKAAQALHVTHGAISHQIKALEADLGVRLVERAGRGIRLTDEGERFAARIRTAFAELTTAVQEITARANPRQLRVSIAPSLAARWLLPRISRFHAAHPDIDLVVSSAIAIVDFQRDDADVAIRYGYGRWEGVRVEHLLDDAFFPVCSPRIAGGVPRSPADLARYPLLRADDEPWKPWFEAAGLDWPEPARGPIFSDSALLMQAAAEGQGIALGRRTLLGNDERNGVLVRPFAIETPTPRRIYLVHPPRKADSPKIAAFREWLMAEIAADRREEEARTSTGRRPAPVRERGATGARKRH
jgi:LysR family glycine cleavage system transcriptional activator